MRYFWGIDPGKNAAMGIIDGDGHYVDCFDFDGTDECRYAAIAQESDNVYSPDLIVIEQVHSFPGQGVSSTFKFGMSYGIIRGVIATLERPYEFITPHRWKKAVGDSEPLKSPDDAIRLANRLWPDAKLTRKKDHNRACALLMARYARMRSSGNGNAQ